MLAPSIAAQFLPCSLGQQAFVSYWLRGCELDRSISGGDSKPGSCLSKAVKQVANNVTH